jgi:hypothetical protein
MKKSMILLIPGVLLLMSARDRSKKLSEEEIQKDVAFTKVVAQEETFAIELGRLAQKKGFFSITKDLGKVLESEISESKNELSEEIKKNGNALFSELNSKQKKELSRLSDLKNYEFDKEFTYAAVKATRQIAHEINVESMKGNNTRLKNWALKRSFKADELYSTTKVCHKIIKKQTKGTGSGMFNFKARPHKKPAAI